MHARLSAPVLDDLSFLDDRGCTAPQSRTWNLAAALALMNETDGAIATSGVSGADPSIRVAVDQCAKAFQAKNLAGVAAACRAIRDRLQRNR